MKTKAFKSTATAAAAAVLLGLMASSAHAALQARDLDGNGVSDAYYDTELDITWLADWNYANTSGYSTAYGGRMTWIEAMAWAAGLTFGGYTDWRLPTIVDTGAPGCDFAYTNTDCGYNVQTKDGGTVYSEMAHLWYETLGNLAYYDTSGSSPQSGWGLTNTGPFVNMKSDDYWSGTAYAPSPSSYAWLFDTLYGYQYYWGQSGWLYAVAVRPGDVFAGAVPEPHMFIPALFGVGVIGLARRRRTSD